MKISGGFTHFAGGSVAIEIGGTAAGQFGRITINRSAHSTRSASLRAAAPLRAAAVGNGKQFAVTYGASGLTVNTVAPSAHSASLRAPAPAQGTRASPLPHGLESPWHIQSITKVDDSFHIEFQSIAGRSYRIEWTDDLVAGKWTVLTQEAIAGTGAIIKVIDAGAGTQKQGFYRVVETQTAAMKNREVTRCELP